MTGARPRLLFFQYRYDPRLPAFVVQHARDHVRCLSRFFDVTVVSEDCDYARACETHRADLVLFEGGVNHASCRRPEVTNTRAHASIPKAGLHNADAFCNARAGFLSDMERLGVETYFAISTTAAEHTPEMADRVFSWPNFVDPEVYRDYGENRNIPVLFTGNKNALYPWRRRMLQLLSERYPSLLCPHPGYDPGATPMQVMQGERYARTINASWLVPACGTVAREVVRKHFEVPACRAALLAERSEGLEAAGFVDMENCVFAGDRDVLDKVEWLFRDPERLLALIDRGHRLAHSRHTAEQRDQILQWYRLRVALPPGQRIVQDGPFGPLRAVGAESGAATLHVRGRGLHLALLREADALVDAEPAAAEALYARCAGYMPWMPEVKLGTARCRLHAGDAAGAAAILDAQLAYVLEQYRAQDPDPVEWALRIVARLCAGELAEAARDAGRFPDLAHPELERARAAVAVLSEPGRAFVAPDRGRRASVHPLPRRTDAEWIDEVCRMLQANGRSALARRLSASHPDARWREGTGARGPRPRRDRARRGWMGRALGSAAATALRRLVGGSLHRLERRWGYFLPYALSEMKRDEFFGEVRQLVRDEEIRRAAVIGAARGEGTTEAFLAGILENQNRPRVLCVNGEGRPLRQLEEAFARSGRVSCAPLAPSPSGDLAPAISRALRTLDADGRSRIDVVVVDGSALSPATAAAGGLDRELHRARFVVLDDINEAYNREHHAGLLRDPDYVLVAQNPGLRNGYAIFKRAAPRSGEAAAC
jgi:hypothetical protein